MLEYDKNIDSIKLMAHPIYLFNIIAAVYLFLVFICMVLVLSCSNSIASMQ